MTTSRFQISLPSRLAGVQTTWLGQVFLYLIGQVVNFCPGRLADLYSAGCSRSGYAASQASVWLLLREQISLSQVLIHALHHPLSVIEDRSSKVRL